MRTFKMFSVIFTVILLAGVCYGAPTSAASNATQLIAGPRIVNGSPIDIAHLPHIAQGERNWPPWNTWCAGTILANHIVVSAAHCFDLVNVGVHNYRIRAGATYRNRGGSIHYIDRIIMHPNWQNPNVAADGDICILRMRNFFVWGHYIQSIPILPQGFVIPHNSPGRFAGWGALGTGLSPPDRLLNVWVNIISHEDCERRYGGPIHRDVVCAGYGGLGACQGDSGGPLYWGTSLAGIIAWGGEICAQFPTASMRTAYYSDWIVANSW